PYYRATTITIRAPERQQIEAVFEVLEKNVDRCKLPPLPEEPKPLPRVFIGHGGSGQWKELKDHLHEKHGYNIEAYEIGARAGHTIRDILEEMLDKSSFAILVMTGEDEVKDGGMQARQNVIHELGLFQGRLGFTKAIVLLEDGTEEFSNIHGVNQIRYGKGNIKETFGEVLATLKREFGNS
ncbi:MAG: nucleotide-binding protein, partial [Methanotrichaceae archaeon]